MSYRLKLKPGETSVAHVAPIYGSFWARWASSSSCSSYSSPWADMCRWAILHSQALKTCAAHVAHVAHQWETLERSYSSSSYTVSWSLRGVECWQYSGVMYCGYIVPLWAVLCLAVSTLILRVLAAPQYIYSQYSQYIPSMTHTEMSIYDIFGGQYWRRCG